MGAMGLLLHCSSNAEVAGCLEGSSTAKQSSSATETPPGGVVPDRTVKPDLATSRVLLRMSPAACVINAFRL